MNRQIIRCGNYFGQKYKGVFNSGNILFKEEKKSIISNVDKDIYSTLSNLYFCHHNLNKYEKRITIGGDHSTTIASLGWTLNNFPKSKVVWIDAHADINTKKSSKTKNYHGMPLSFLTGIDFNNKFNFLKEKLNLKNLLYVGIRDLDVFEKNIINDHNVKFVDVKTFNNNDFDIIYDFIKDNDYHLSFDVDAIDPKFIPCTGTPVNNGLNLSSFNKFISELNIENMINMDIVELNLSLGDKKDFERSLASINEIENTLSDKFRD